MAYFETPPYLRQRLPEVSDAFIDIFSDGFRFPETSFQSKVRTLNTNLTLILFFKVILRV